MRKYLDCCSPYVIQLNKFTGAYHNILQRVFDYKRHAPVKVT